MNNFTYYQLDNGNNYTKGVHMCECVKHKCSQIECVYLHEYIQIKMRRYACFLVCMNFSVPLLTVAYINGYSGVNLSFRCACLRICRSLSVLN